MKNWKRQFGEEEVNVGVTHLLNHVAKCWQPSWYQFAGALIPAALREEHGAVVPEPHVKDQSSTGNGSNTSPPPAIANLANTEVHSDGHANPPSPLHTVLLQIPFLDTEAHASTLRGAPTSVVEDIDRLQSPAILKSSKQESAPALELEGCLRPRRQARDKALAKIRKSQGQPKKRSRLSGSNISPPAKRRKATAAGLNQHTEASIETEEEEQEKTEVEGVLQEHDEVIPPIRSTPIQQIAQSLTTLTCIFVSSCAEDMYI